MAKILKWEEFNVFEKHDPNAKIRNRGDVVFSADDEKVLDDKDHFPINTINQARNALARASQYDVSPDWYDGSLTKLVRKVRDRVKEKYPNIETTKKSVNSGKD